MMTQQDSTLGLWKGRWEKASWKCMLKAIKAKSKKEAAEPMWHVDFR
jgi:hypothetical protein